jgi:hypothetical protein
LVSESLIFQRSVKEWKSHFDVSIQALKEVSGDAKAQYESKITGLLYHLDGQNNSLMLQFRAAYTAFFSDPCKEDGYFKQQTEIPLKEHMRLTELKMKIQSLLELVKAYPNEPEKLRPLYNEIITRTDGTGVIARDAASLEITKNRDIAKEWAGSHHD